MPTPFPPTLRSSSPWGLIDHLTPLGPDAVAVSTASHGGIAVSAKGLARIPEPLRATAYSGLGWFEEDCDWAIPYLALGLHAFEAEPGRAPRMLDAARRTLWAYHRDHAALLGVSEDPTPAAPEGAAEPEADFACGVAEAAAPVRFVAGVSSRAGELRARCETAGSAVLTESETLELLLARGAPAGADARGAADALMARFGCIGRVLGADPAELARTIGVRGARDLVLLHGLFVRALEFPFHRRSVLSSTEAVKTYLRAALAAAPREAFHVLFLDKANQLILDQRMAVGTVDHAPVYPREIVRRALEVSASALCLVHNHPSGGTSPSSQDIDMTKKVVEAARALSVAVHDHFIVAGDQVISFRGLGLL